MMKLWLVLTILGNINGTWGPQPSDANIVECNQRAIAFQTHVRESMMQHPDAKLPGNPSPEQIRDAPPWVLTPTVIEGLTFHVAAGNTLQGTAAMGWIGALLAERAAVRDAALDIAARIAEAVEMQQDIDHGSANSGGAEQAAAAIRALKSKASP